MIFSKINSDVVRLKFIKIIVNPSNCIYGVYRGWVSSQAAPVMFYGCAERLALLQVKFRCIRGGPNVFHQD